MLVRALVMALTVFAQEPERSAENFFETFAEHRNAVETLEAHFVQITVTPDEIVTSKGTIVYARPKRLIFRYEDPPLVYMIDRLNAYEYDPELEQVQIFELEDRPESEAFYLGFENNADRLQEAYDVRVLPPNDATRHAFALEFRPKEDAEEEDSFFEKISLQLRLDDYLPGEILIVNDAESHVEFTITDFTINGDPPAQKTHINLPEGTVIVENDRYVTTVGPRGLMLPRLDAPRSDENEATP